MELSSEDGSDVDNDHFLCPHCNFKIPICNIGEHTSKCTSKGAKIAGGSVLSRRPLVGSSAVIPAVPPRFGASSAAGPGPTTMKTRGYRLGEDNPNKRHRLDPPRTSMPYQPTRSNEIIELSSDDEPQTQAPIPRAQPPFRFFANRDPPAIRRNGLLTPPPPYSA